MSDTSQGEGWWLASDGKWYPPESAPAPAAPAAPVHGQPALGYAVVARPTANEAIWALVLGIGSFVLCGIFAAIPAIIVGNNAKKKIAASGGAYAGEGMATAGIVLGWIQVGLTVLVGGLFIILVIVGAANGNSN